MFIFYGAYGSNLETSVRLDILPLLKRGFVVVLGHIRGGSELGMGWHEEGKAEKKENTFMDSFSIIRSFVNRGISDSNRIGVVTTSAGGLVLGALLNRFPGIFIITKTKRSYKVCYISSTISRSVIYNDGSLIATIHYRSPRIRKSN